MIWFDAVLERPIEDERLQRGIAAMLAISFDSVSVVHSISEIGSLPVTCVVEPGSADPYSQLITIYLSEPLEHPDILESASRFAVIFDTSLLLANDATANPYSFVKVSSGGQQSVVLVDPDELDENERYVIQESRPISLART
ncbi:hypothetical protein J2X76_006077 [Neorhizobium sp. 2083]|uniref:hypothetical protein n=1 Tax=Neorhizobium sp. 2083 TaxID=2817762 RepID=UPI0028557626|nr:hypothetical protein [Neorhizobium sp. 2083]MDR6820877.1 hypothetical protein [Neorhizobium sp. 2083]